MKTFEKKDNFEGFTKRLTVLAVCLIIAAFITGIPALKAFAAGEVTFGSGSYDAESGSTFNVGVYAGPTDELPIGEYTITLTYDPNVIQYVGGAESGGDGTIVVHNRSEDGGRSMSMLTFRAVGNGATTINVAGATFMDPDGNPMETGGLGSAPINIRQQTTPPPASLTVNGKEVPQFASDKNEYTFAIPFAEEIKVEAPEGFALTSDAGQPVVGRNDIHVTVRQGDMSPRYYTLHVNMQEDSTKKEEETQPAEPVAEPESASEVSSAKEEKDQPLSEEVSEPEIPSLTIMSEPVEKPSAPSVKLSSAVKAILVIAGFLVAIVLVYLTKVLVDRLVGRFGANNDFDRRRKMDLLKSKEEVQNKANPFEFASIDEEPSAKDRKKRQKEHSAITNEEGVVDLFGRNEGQGTGKKGAKSGKQQEDEPEAIAEPETITEPEADTEPETNIEPEAENEPATESGLVDLKLREIPADVSQSVKKVDFGSRRTSVEEMAAIAESKSAEIDENIETEEKTDFEPKITAVFPEASVTIADFGTEGDDAGDGDEFIEYEDEDDFLDIDDIPDRPSKK